MITPLTTEYIETKWEVISAALGKFWNTTANFETLPSLKIKLLNGTNQLWLYSIPDKVEIYYTSYVRHTAKGNILQGVHAGGINVSEEEVNSFIPQLFSEMEQMAKLYGFDAVAINTRRGLIKLLPDYELQSVTLIKRL